MTHQTPVATERCLASGGIAATTPALPPITRLRLSALQLSILKRLDSLGELTARDILDEISTNPIFHSDSPEIRNVYQALGSLRDSNLATVGSYKEGRNGRGVSTFLITELGQRAILVYSV